MNGLMFPSNLSTLLLTILLAVGLIFFLRAASKDRTTVVDIHSPLPALIVLESLGGWLEERGWRRGLSLRFLSFFLKRQIKLQ